MILTDVDTSPRVAVISTFLNLRSIMTDLPVAVIGAGPQGLAAAAHLLERGLTPLVLEQGSEPAAAVAEWGHVRLFSAWPELVDKAAAQLLEPTGWTAPTQG